VHPHLKAGHKGLFAERLDKGVVTGLAGIDRGRLEPGASLLYHARNRTYDPSLGRWLQSDPNASGQAVVASISYGGEATLPTVLAADLNSLVSDGNNLHQYCRSDPVNGRDETGLFYLEYNEAILEAGSELAQSASMLLEDYKERMEEAMDAALDWGTSDEDFGAMLGAPRTPKTIRQTVDPMGSLLGAGTQLEQQAQGGGLEVAVGTKALFKAANSAKKLGKRAAEFAKWLNDGPKDVTVYTRRGPDGKIDYVGITKNLNRREYEHGRKLYYFAGPMTRRQARAVETLLMTENRWLFDTGGNKILSISASHPMADRAKLWAKRLFQNVSIGR
jgi:hypothetical protein